MNGWYDVAARQYGAISRAQLREQGLSDRQVDRLLANGNLEREFAGVFRVAGSYRSFHQRVSLALLWCGSESQLASRTAGRLMRFPLQRSAFLDLAVPPSVRRFHDDIRVHRTLAMPTPFFVDGLACTFPVRTIVDLAADLDGEQLEHVFESARRFGLVTATVFRQHAEPLLTNGRRGAANVRDLLLAIDGRPAESRLEVRVARLLRAAGIRPDAVQHVVGPYRIDFVLSLRDKRGLECDGFDWHGNRTAWKRDRRRISWLEARGWRLTHVTWADVTDRPNETLTRLQAA